MSSAGVMVGEAAGRKQRNRAWILLAGILLGLCSWGGTAAAEPAPDVKGGGGCAGGEAAEEVTLPSGATAAVCEEAPVTTSAEGLSVVLSKTVGTDGDSCAASTEITVTSATETAYYCYTVTNDGTVTATSHDLVDDRLGSLLSGYAYDLVPGGSTFATAAESLVGEGPVVINIGTWTAHAGEDSVESEAQAKVTIVDGPTAPSPITATANEGGARVAWTVPSSNGGQVITGYRITPIDGSTPGTPVTTAAGTLSYDFTGLTNGHTYTFDVAAITANGDGATGQSNAVTPQWWRPWTSGNKAVTEIYTWLTGKAPTSAQLSAFVASANANGKLPGDLVSALRDGTDATSNVDPVIRLYSAYFLRTPDTNGLNYWLNRRRSGWTLSRISDNFAASSEFKRRYGSLSNTNYVKLVYQNVLNRPPDSDGLAYWKGQLDAKKKSRGQVMLNFSDSNEYKNKRATYVDAVSLYLQFLGRSPTGTQLSDLQAQLAGSSVAAVTRELIHAPSFDARAG
ncbi:DUF4214 domain-containing protein [Aquihabitans daechungensis]|uniref:DUF4214 domain-containing protein n=1 Tax=Aquihabitans daechungensis TaxID=1052257 RepID=UPI003B9DCF12